METTFTYNDRDVITGLFGIADEQEGSPSLGWENDQNSVCRKFKVLAEDCSALGEALLVSSSVDGTEITVNKPCSSLISGGFSRAYSLKLDPFGQTQFTTIQDSESMAGSPWWLATVMYRQLPAIEEEYAPGGEFLTLPPTQFYWNSDGVSLLNNEAPGQFFAKGVWNLTRHWLPTIPAEYYSLIGGVNTAAITSLRYGMEFPIGTLCYQNPVIRSYYDYQGNMMNSVTARMLYRAGGWNNFWRAKTQAWDTINSKTSGASVSGSVWTGGTAYTPYTPGDFSVIAVYEDDDV